MTVSPSTEKMTKTVAGLISEYGPQRELEVSETASNFLVVSDPELGEFIVTILPLVMLGKGE